MPFSLIQNTMFLESDEIAICLLIVRLKHLEVRRQKWVLAGISYLLYNYPSKLIKPIKWFMKNIKEFMDVSVISVLQILFEYSEIDNNYAKNFKQELEELLPSSNFTKDSIISILLDLEQIEYENKPDESTTSTNIDPAKVEFISEMNSRNRFLSRYVFDLEPLVAKYFDAINKKEYSEHVSRMFFNRMYETVVENICFENEWLKIVNEDLIKLISNSEYVMDIDMIFYKMSFDIKAVIAYQNSLSIRPKMPLPREINTNDDSIEVNDGWVLLANYEKQSQFKRSYSDDTETLDQSIGGIVFGMGCRFPFSEYQLDTKSIWEPPGREHFGLKHFKSAMVLSSIEHQNLERMFLLWIYPEMLATLGLEVSSFNEGIQAVNEQGDVILKLVCWECDFLGYEKITDEIAKLEGAQLLMREDYFQKLCSIIKAKPKYLKVII